MAPEQGRAESSSGEGLKCEIKGGNVRKKKKEKNYIYMSHDENAIPSVLPLNLNAFRKNSI